MHKFSVKPREFSQLPKGWSILNHSHLTCVYVGVFLHVGLLVEPLSAVLARVRPRVRVDEEVRGERGAPLERLAALLARERPLVRVHRPARKRRSDDTL